VVPTDKGSRDDEGNLILPVKLASLTILDFGEVRSEEAFHSNQNFFPVGWKSI
jgi:hypothetical protein